MPQIPFKDFITCTLFTFVDEIYPLFNENLVNVSKQSYHLSNSKSHYFQPEQLKVRDIILN